MEKIMLKGRINEKINGKMGKTTNLLDPETSQIQPKRSPILRNSVDYGGRNAGNVGKEKIGRDRETGIVNIKIPISMTNNKTKSMRSSHDNHGHTGPKYATNNKFRARNEHRMSVAEATGVSGLATERSR